MALTRLQHQGNTLSTSYSTLQTATSGLATLGYVVRKIYVTNVISVTSTATSVVRDVDVHLVADSSSAVTLNRIWSGSVAPGVGLGIPGPWWGTSGATVQARIATSGAGADVAVRVASFQET